MKHPDKNHTEKGVRIRVDRREREVGYMMPAYHHHPFYELSYLEQGSCRWLTEDTVCELQAGDMVLVPPAVLHHTRYPYSDCRRTGIYFSLSDISTDVISLFREQTAFFGRPRIFRIPPEHRPRIEALIGQMTEEEQNPDENSPLLLRLKLQELLVLLSRFCGPAPEIPAGIRTSDLQILEAVRYIGENYRQRITAKDIAGASGFSPNYLSRKFREATGVGVHEYLIFVRLRSAAAELISSDASVTEIAIRCGFADQSHFTRVFSAHVGASPAAWRRAHRDAHVPDVVALLREAGARGQA